MLTTSNYALKKPEGTDIVNIDDFNFNADTIDKTLKSLSDGKAPSGYGLGTTATDISGKDLSNIVSTGFYRGSGVTNAPSNQWFYFIVMQHSDNNWNWQYAVTFGTNNDANKIYSRVKANGTWTSWKQLATTDMIPSSLPANGGNSDTVDGKHASDFATYDFMRNNAVEIGETIDFHKWGSNSDYDARLSMDETTFLPYWNGKKLLNSDDFSTLYNLANSSKISECTPTVLNGWILEYHFSVTRTGNTVTISGSIKPGTIANQPYIFQLPSGFRPYFDSDFVSVCPYLNNDLRQNSVVYFRVLTNGKCIYLGSNPAITNGGNTSIKLEFTYRGE
ncbi:hypothetical protein CLOBY_18260 [Clostridium saccharobutylicum]|uniref:pyocin knob domain-containing protein n=1 Tax=Clostridium saccharobutylicum TaxID=169679 RepID=UPI000983FDAD|nr:pyocin knob domain-containing protein [Clostridium saccharobutylicum]AQS09695.1 hypothetical protein CLOBY_18260 [Clostridium saccharobutylicum]MBC2436911.1 hypothetical protein [Clostridium saccharobutylicum]NSB89259.1 hypothetical protein [Clostridium saccharobutylicum]NYC27913.1 hypothetical protein [Clostridium saccharobutylicum]OOM17110.1 hypothetical protein CLSAB_20580 [Clostridium saccharobutylicum]